MNTTVKYEYMTLLNCVHIWWLTGRICAWWNSCPSGQLLLPWLHHVFNLPSLLQYQAIDWNVNWPIQSTKTWPSDWSIVLLHESVWQAPNKQGLHCTCVCLCLPICLFGPATDRKLQFKQVTMMKCLGVLHKWHKWGVGSISWLVRRGRGRANYVWTLR